MKRNYQQWTTKEVQFLKDNHANMNILELAEALGRKEKNVVNFCKRSGISYFREKKEYALYKEDKLLKIGTIREIATFLGIKPESISFYGTPTYQKRVKGGKGRTLIKL